jgi:hypothetical protein
MAGGPVYLVEILDEQTGIVIYRWSGNAPNEYDALTLAKTELEKERSG